MSCVSNSVNSEQDKIRRVKKNACATNQYHSKSANGQDAVPASGLHDCGTTLGSGLDQAALPCCAISWILISCEPGYGAPSSI